MILPDLLSADLDLVICGTAASNRSAQVKAYYAGRGNLFYTILTTCEFTPRLLKPEEFPELLNYKIGLTDLVKFNSGMDKNLSHGEYDIKAFELKILQYQPKVVCFNGKKAASKYLNIADTKKIFYGIQTTTIGKTLLFIAPSTSSQAIAYWNESIWQDLKMLIHRYNNETRTLDRATPPI